MWRPYINVYDWKWDELSPVTDYFYIFSFSFTDKQKLQKFNLNESWSSLLCNFFHYTPIFLELTNQHLQDTYPQSTWAKTITIFKKSDLRPTLKMFELEY